MIRFSRKLPVLTLVCCTVLFATLSIASSSAAEKEENEKSTPAPSVKDQLLGLESMCAENAESTAATDSAKSLYERLGGREHIHKIVAEVIRLHGENKDFDRFMGKVDRKHLIESVTQFMVAASGGPDEYKGPSLPSSHAHLKLTNADFLSAGHDVMLGMKKQEINEVLCMFMSLRDQVVIDSDKEFK